MNSATADTPPCTVLDLPVADAVNREIVAAYQRLKHDSELERTHFFAGRYENVYVPRERIPALATVLDAARREAARLLEIPAARLGTGFWFNEMGPGHVTLPHTHDDDDELLSAVYYLQVPAHSGDLVLGSGGTAARVEPRAGRLVLFAPDLVHEVTENRSGAMRLSIGMNFGVRATDAA